MRIDLRCERTDLDDQQTSWLASSVFSHAQSPDCTETLSVDRIVSDVTMGFPAGVTIQEAMYHFLVLGRCIHSEALLSSSVPEAGSTQLALVQGPLHQRSAKAGQRQAIE